MHQQSPRLTPSSVGNIVTVVVLLSGLVLVIFFTTSGKGDQPAPVPSVSSATPVVAETISPKALVSIDFRDDRCQSLKDNLLVRVQCFVSARNYLEAQDTTDSLRARVRPYATDRYMANDSMTVSRDTLADRVRIAQNMVITGTTTGMISGEPLGDLMRISAWVIRSTGTPAILTESYWTHTTRGWLIESYSTIDSIEGE